jgi:two-component system, NtrC family, response regulator HydG
MATILCVDEPSVGVILKHALAQIGHRPLLVSRVEEAMEAVARTPIDLIIADCPMPRPADLDLLALLEKQRYRLPVIIMTDSSSLEHAVSSIKSGAITYLTKPIRSEALEIAVHQALEVARLRRENETFRREILKIRSSQSLIGESEPFRRVMAVVDVVAPTRATVLLQGESGTGKKLFARAIHDQSLRHDAPFITINCATIEGLVESALFGHQEGPFTGVTERTAGAFERAHTGTLVLDEISEMPLSLQAKLVRAIQEQAVERVGGTQPSKVDVRLIATTNRDLKAEVDAGKFRGDLYDRLNAVPLRTPPLRDRVQDIPLLVHHFIHRMAEHQDTPEPAVAPETIQLLQRYSWPGNVRELANAIERAVILSRGTVLQPAAFDQHLREGGNPADAQLFDLDEIERRAIDRALEATGGNRTRAAKLLGISERTLRNKLNGPKADAATGT